MLGAELKFKFKTNPLVLGVVGSIRKRSRKRFDSTLLYLANARQMNTISRENTFNIKNTIKKKCKTHGKERMSERGSIVNKGIFTV